MTEEERQPEQSGSMTTGEIMAAIQENQRHIEQFLDQLSLRSSLEGYAEQQQDELLTLIEEALTYIESIPVSSEWIAKRDELIIKLRETLE